VSCGTRRHEARPGYVRLLKVRDGAGAKDPRLDPQALSELQGHPLPEGETPEVTLMRFFDAQRNSRDCGRAASSSPCGGGFGAKMHVYCEELLVCVLAKLLDRSVRWIETRPEHVVATVHAREIVHDVEVATDEQGRMLALRALTGDTDRGSRTAGLRARSLMTEPHAELWTAKSTSRRGGELTAPGDTWLGRPRMVPAPQTAW